MSHYDHIAQHWHTITGARGGAFKELVLNPLLLEKLVRIDQCAILELGAGNGYFWPLAHQHFAPQTPTSLMITDHSEHLLAVAQQHFPLPKARYTPLNVADPFPFADHQFDIILASMLFNEVSGRVFQHALRECQRVLAPAGRLLIAVTHPDFIEQLQQRGLLTPTVEGGLTMPGAGTLRLPVVRRTIAHYRRGLQAAGFAYEEDESYATPEVIARSAGLRHAWKIPIALVYACVKN